MPYGQTEGDDCKTINDRSNDNIHHLIDLGSDVGVCFVRYQTLTPHDVSSASIKQQPRDEDYLDGFMLTCMLQ
jgi:hypothetical protein